MVVLDAGGFAFVSLAIRTINVSNFQGVWVVGFGLPGWGVLSGNQSD